jgi:hypothetical protein
MSASDAALTKPDATPTGGIAGDSLPRARVHLGRGRPGRRPRPARRTRVRCGHLMLVATAIGLASCTSGGGGTSPVPTASPSEGRIAFDRMNGAATYMGGYLGTVTANADGTDEQPLPIPTDWSGPVSPVWSPDGSQLAVSVWRGFVQRSAVVHPDGSGFRVLAPGKKLVSAVVRWSMPQACPKQAHRP